MSGTNGRRSQVARLPETTADLVKEKTDSPASGSPSRKGIWLSRAFMVILTVYLTTVFMVLLLPVFKLFGAK